MLGIVGAPGSGKSTVSEQLAARIESIAVVPMDGFHLRNDRLDELGRRNRKGAPDTFDVDGYVALLQQLRGRPPGEVIRAPKYDRLKGEPVADVLVIGDDVRLVVTEGNYLLHDQGGWERVRPLLDEVWYVDIDDDIRVSRLIARHIEYGKSTAAAREWVMRSDEANAALVLGTRHRADVLVVEAD